MTTFLDKYKEIYGNEDFVPYLISLDLPEYILASELPLNEDFIEAVDSGSMFEDMVLEVRGGYVYDVKIKGKSISWDAMCKLIPNHLLPKTLGGFNPFPRTLDECLNFEIPCFIRPVFQAEKDFPLVYKHAS